ncbi:Anti-sigma factor antagonist domain of sulfate transporter91 [Cocos nucifera]|nr:Anti-sigma factor antagonist domain of sulfate transporter91 [Cocos nucifera]
MQEGHQVEIAVMEVMRKVVPPPPRSSLDKIKLRLKETFFPDDPFRRFKGQPPKKKWILGAQYLFPILGWAPTYDLSHFKSDLVSGLTIASLAIPQGISYAQLANLPPIIGLCISRDIQASHQLGFIIDFLSKATLTGFMAGAAIIVSLQQLKSMLGIVHFTKQMGLVPVMSSVFHNTDESTRRPKLFWVSAGAPLTSVVLSTLLVFVFKAQNHGISIIGQLKSGLNRPSWDKLHFDSTYLGTVMKTGLVTGIISLTEGVAVGRTFASLKDYRVDGNKEMMAIGLMNIVGSCTSCYVTTVRKNDSPSFATSTIGLYDVPLRDLFSQIVERIECFEIYARCFFPFSREPSSRIQDCSIQHSDVCDAVIGLIDVPAAYHLWKMDKIDFIVCLCAFLGVLFISVQDGLAIAVMTVFVVLVSFDAW